VVLHTLATGARQEFIADDTWRAALSPDGKHLGARKPLWSGEGWWEEASISWSPDGHLLAATYETVDDVLTTVVVDLSGKPIGVYDEWGRSSFAALGLAVQPGTDRLSRPDDEMPFIAIDVTTGNQHRFTRRDFRGYLAASGGRVVREGSSPGQFATTDLDDGDERPFLAFNPAVAIKTLDIPPSTAR